MLLKQLYHLQELERKELEIRQSLKSLPQLKELKKMKKRFLEKQEQLAEAQEAFEKISARLNQSEKQVQDVEEKTRSLKELLYGGTSNNAKELENIDQQLKVLNEQIAKFNLGNLEMMEEKEDLGQKLGQIEQELKVQYQKFNKLKLQYNQVKLNMEQELRGIEEDKQEIMADLDDQSRSWFQARKEKFDGYPIGKIMENHACSGCHTVIPIIIVKEARLKKELVYCECCGRALYAPQLI
ncbi:MAG: zinc ribbon domain-containing protein [Dehalobacterium sp.]